MSSDSSIRELKGIGEKTERLFHRAGVRSIRDLLLFFPRTYDLYENPISISEAPSNKICTICGTLMGKVQVGGSKKLPVTTAYVRDKESVLKIVWFRMPFLRALLSGGGAVILRGRIKYVRNELVMEQPEVFYPPDTYEKKLSSLQPVYRLVSGLSNSLVQKTVAQALPMLTREMDLIPPVIEKELELLPLRESFSAMHFPKTKDEYIAGRRRFVFQEFFLFILALSTLKKKTSVYLNRHKIRSDQRTDSFVDALPFALTDAQKKVWAVIRRDLAGDRPMARLVQGDVGCGKTIVAFLALLDCVFSGFQGAMMAPTEVLARQHYKNFIDLVETYNLPVRVALLTGSMSVKEKRLVKQSLMDGNSHIVVGTHTLFQDSVEFDRLALVVTDEQHRFGVEQREKLAKKGDRPHVLVMSATPIPRSMAIILYGDLDISVIDERPKNRLPVRNCVADTSYRGSAYRFLEEELGKGRQCYVICPMIEDSETSEAQSVFAYSEKLRHTYKNRYTIGMLHGKMPQDEKDAVMADFYEKKIHILVATTVIEVGIDVPNATVILIENAESFGLAQLHQLRGRVGRGEHQSYCIFISGVKNEETLKRLDILKQSNDGFFISSEDLKMRGPGDLFGIRQSGEFQFQIADIYQDSDVLTCASEAAKRILTMDPLLERPEHRYIKREIARFTGEKELGATL